MLQFLIQGFLSWFWYDCSVSFQCTVVANVVFWVCSFLGLAVDYAAYTGNSSVRAYKIQPRHSVFQGRDDLRDLIVLAAVNMLGVSFGICCPLYEFLWNRLYLNHHRLDWTDPWNGPWEVFLKLPVHILLTEFWFYGTHVLLHSIPLFYRNIHSVHHRFKAPTAMCCVYAHPLEFIVANAAPIYFSAMLTNAHPRTCYLWWAMSIAGTCKGHCGYSIFGRWRDYHEEHHAWLRYNYGGIVLSDWIFGTLTYKRIGGTRRATNGKY